MYIGCLEALCVRYLRYYYDIRFTKKNTWNFITIFSMEHGNFKQL